MELYPLKSGLVLPGEPLIPKIQEALTKSRIRLRNRDIIAIASKVVAISEGRIRQLSDVKPTPEATRLGRKYSMPAEFAQVVLEESEKIYGGVPGALLTLKNGQAAANAGVDRKNAPGNGVVLWPLDAAASAKRLRKGLKERTGEDVGLIIVDSRVTPLRLGTIGVSLASVGFRRVRDFRGKPDLFGRRARITFQAVADGIAGAAQLLMGEARESTPFVLVRGASVEFDGRGGEAETRLSERDCLYMSQILKPSLKPRG